MATRMAAVREDELCADSTLEQNSSTEIPVISLISCNASHILGSSRTLVRRPLTVIFRLIRVLDMGSDSDGDDLRIRCLTVHGTTLMYQHFRM